MLDPQHWKNGVLDPDPGQKAILANPDPETNLSRTPENSYTVP
jgi:hypothetical protein